MELVERLKKIMRDEFGITNDEELLEAVENMQGVDLGIFVKPIGRRGNEKTA